MDLRRLRIGELMLCAAGGALLASLFLPWYGTAGGTLTGFQSLAVLDLVLALIALAALSLLPITAGQRVPAVPIALEALVTGAGIVAVLLVLAPLLWRRTHPLGAVVASFGLLTVVDKVRILASVKSAWQGRVTTVWPRQGHYALDVADVARYPAPDVTLERIGDLVDQHLDGLLAAGKTPASG